MQEGEVGVFEPDGGVLNPERAIEAQLNVAAARGAQMHFGVALKNWRAMRDGFEILLADDTRISARVLVLSLGPWFKAALEALGVPMRVQRNVQAWFSPRTGATTPAGFPPFSSTGKNCPRHSMASLISATESKRPFTASAISPTRSTAIVRIDHARDIAPLAQLLEEWMPGAAGPLRDAKPCMYSLTPDEHFVIDRHPASSRI